MSLLNYKAEAFEKYDLPLSNFRNHLIEFLNHETNFGPRQ